MVEHISDDILKSRILELVKKDENFKLALIGALSSGFMTKTEFQQLLKEIKQQRKDMHEEFKFIRIEIRKIWEEIARLREETKENKEELIKLREETKKIWEEIARLREETKKIWEEIAKTRNEYSKRFDRIDRKLMNLKNLISAIGGRWGIDTERAFRDAFINLAKEVANAKITRLKLRDEEGIVYGVPSDVEVDLAIQNKQHILIEIKTRVRKSDVAELLRIGTLYEMKYKVKPKLMFITPLVDKNAYNFAIKNDIEIYNYLAEDHLEEE